MIPADGLVRERVDGCSLAVRVQPGARRTAITGIHEDEQQPQLKVALKAPPIEGRANEALIVFLAEFFALSRSKVTIAHGETGRSKLILLAGVKKADALARLSL